MKTNMRRPFCFALIALFPVSVFAQWGSKDPDTVNLDNVKDFYVQNAKAGTPGNPSTVDPDAFDSEMANFKNQNNTGTMTQLQQDLRQMRLDYKTMVNEANQAMRSKDPNEQLHLFGTFMFESRNYLRDHPDASYLLWLLRAIAAVNLNKPTAGTQAGQILLMAPAQARSDPRIARILAFLENKGWLPKDASAAAAPAAGK
jgi:hypothetical protein